MIFFNYRSFGRVSNAFLSTYFSDILDLLRSSTTRKDQEEAAVVENVEVDVEEEAVVVENVEVNVEEEEDCEDEVLVLEDTTGCQDRESAEVIISLTLIRLCRDADPDPHNFNRWIRIHIRVKSWIRILFKAKIHEL